MNIAGYDNRRQLVLGGLNNPSVALDRLDNGVYFAMFQGLTTDPARPLGIHRYRYEYRIGWGPEKGDWLFRYEYVENPAAEYEGQYIYANSHMHINAEPNARFLADFPSRHFPTGKLWLEQILAGVCADVILPRLQAHGKDESQVTASLAIIQARISLLSSS